MATIGLGALKMKGRRFRQIEIEGRAAVFAHVSIEIDERPDTFGHHVRQLGGDEAAVGVADQNDIREIFGAHQVRDVLDMGGGVDGGRMEMRAFAQSRERWGQHMVAARAEDLGNASITPAAVPCAMGENEGRGDCHGDAAGVQKTFCSRRDTKKPWPLRLVQVTPVSSTAHVMPLRDQLVP